MSKQNLKHGRVRKTGGCQNKDTQVGLKNETICVLDKNKLLILDVK